MKQIMFCVDRNALNALNEGNNCGVVNFDEKSGYFEGFIFHLMGDDKFHNTYLVFGVKNDESIEMYEIGNGHHTSRTFYTIFYPPFLLSAHSFYMGESRELVYDNYPNVYESNLSINSWYRNGWGVEWKHDWTQEEISSCVDELVKYMSSEENKARVAMEKFIGMYWNFKNRFYSDPHKSKNLVKEISAKGTL